MEITMDRGNIHEFLDKFGNVDGRALVVSDQSRNRDNVISILKLSPVGTGPDAVVVAYDTATDKYWYVHCGCVSYAYRNRLGRKTGALTESTMEMVDKRIMEQLGLKEETVSYKKLYEGLIERMELKEA